MQEIIVDDTTSKKFRRKSNIAFMIFTILILTAIAGWRYLYYSPKDGGLFGGVQTPLRKVLNKNEVVFSSLFSPNKLVKEYPKNMAVRNVKVNGDVGMDTDLFDVSLWKLQLVKATNDTLFITLDDIKKLPKTEVVYNFKCIEGWSQITWWGGVRFIDLVQHYGLGNEAQFKYVGMKTPDEEYYVGIDMPSMIQPQTILCYEMNGKPLPINQGYPLRLIIPVKYGVKHIKRIGTLFFANDKPKDYWAERGYDYYTGH
jgi:DMSO/TMAO reductase YedYZ molybdopterin-dependent catalytic subunit